MKKVKKMGYFIKYEDETLEESLEAEFASGPLYNTKKSAKKVMDNSIQKYGIKNPKVYKVLVEEV